MSTFVPEEWLLYIKVIKVFHRDKVERVLLHPGSDTG